MEEVPINTENIPTEPWPGEPLTAPVCPYCGRKERPSVIESPGSEHIVYECPSCDRQWTVRLHSPQESGIRSTRRR